MTDRERPADDDAALSALLDGALPAEEAAALRRRLRQEPALARRQEELRQVDQALRHAYGGVAEEPLPAPVVELLRPLSQRARRRPSPPARARWLGLPAAAGVGLLAGLLLALWMLSRNHAIAPPGLVESGLVERRSALEAVLETAPTGESRLLGDGWSATPRLTFRSIEGQPCRRVDLRRQASGLETLVCRREGAWRVAVVGFGSAGGDDLYRPAAGGSPSPIDAAIGALAAAPPLDREAERAWISRGWRDPADR